MLNFPRSGITQKPVAPVFQPPQQDLEVTPALSNVLESILGRPTSGTSGFFTVSPTTIIPDNTRPIPIQNQQNTFFTAPAAGGSDFSSLMPMFQIFASTVTLMGKTLLSKPRFSSPVDEDGPVDGLETKTKPRSTVGENDPDLPYVDLPPKGTKPSTEDVDGNNADIRSVPDHQRAAAALKAVREADKDYTGDIDNEYLESFIKKHAGSNVRHAAEILLGNNSEVRANLALKKLYGTDDSATAGDIDTYLEKYDPAKLPVVKGSGKPDDATAKKNLEILAEKYSSREESWTDDFFRSVIVDHPDDQELVDAAKALLGQDENEDVRASIEALREDIGTDRLTRTQIKKFIDSPAVEPGSKSDPKKDDPAFTLSDADTKTSLEPFVKDPDLLLDSGVPVDADGVYNLKDALQKVKDNKGATRYDDATVAAATKLLGDPERLTAIADFRGIKGDGLVTKADLSEYMDKLGTEPAAETSVVERVTEVPDATKMDKPGAIAALKSILEAYPSKTDIWDDAFLNQVVVEHPNDAIGVNAQKLLGNTKEPAIRAAFMALTGPHTPTGAPGASSHDVAEFINTNGNNVQTPGTPVVDSAPAKTTQEILKPGYQASNVSGDKNIGFLDGQDYASSLKQGQTYGIMVNNTADKFTFQSNFGMKNGRAVIETDRLDKLEFGGTGWHATQNVTDALSQRTGTLYEDDKGNKVLAVGENAGVELNVEFNQKL